MRVDPATSKHRLARAGTSYHFCSAGCRSKFEADPDKYLTTVAEAQPETPKSGAIYTCPTHPQIRQDGPGNCPICGMMLTVHCELDSADYPKGIVVSDREIDGLNTSRNAFLGEWNYTMQPSTPSVRALVSG